MSRLIAHKRIIIGQSIHRAYFIKNTDQAAYTLFL